MNGKLLFAVVVGVGILGWVTLRQSKPDTVVAQKTASTSSLSENRSEAQLPAPKVRVIAPAAEPEPAKTNLFSRLVKGDVPKLTAEQVEGYLTQNHRDAGSLLGAFRETGDLAFLKVAEEKFPNDPRVAYAAAFKSDSPEERGQWLDRWKQADSGNALPDYLSALDAFKAGRTDQALQQLSGANGKLDFQDYTLDFLQNAEDAYRSAGFSDADAKTISATQLLLPDLSQLRDLGRQIVSLANSYQQAGDTASAQAALQMSTALGQRFGDFAGEPLISQLVGIAIERDALGAMDPSTQLGDGQTVQNRLDQLNQTRQTLKDLGQQEEGLFQRMSEQDVISYWDRWRAFGSEATLKWAIAKYGKG